jgi:hypothetical protein
LFHSVEVIISWSRGSNENSQNNFPDCLYADNKPCRAFAGSSRVLFPVGRHNRAAKAVDVSKGRMEKREQYQRCCHQTALHKSKREKKCMIAVHMPPVWVSGCWVRLITGLGIIVGVGVASVRMSGFSSTFPSSLRAVNV